MLGLASNFPGHGHVTFRQIWREEIHESVNGLATASFSVKLSL